MNVSGLTDWLRQHQLPGAIVGGTVLLAISLLVLGQPLAAVFALIVGALWCELERRNQRARTLAQRLSDGVPLEKLEVQQGGWGELCRAINGLVQEQREQNRLHTTPVFQPLDRSRVAPSEVQRTVSVLLIGCGQTQTGGRARRPSVQAWQSLANATRQVAQQHGALLQPCGDAIMVVFGAHGDRPVETSLLQAVGSAERLRGAWQRAGNSGALAFSLTSGSVAVTTLPGLGCCVLGAPVEQALQIERLALASPFYGMLCDEAAYFALRRHRSQRWQPTEYRVQTPDGRRQVVYGVTA